MKHIWLILFSVIIHSLGAQQIIENPSFKIRTGSILNIQKIERSDTYTRLHAHVIFRPHWWISIDSTIYIEDAATSQKFKATAIEGMEFNKETYLPESGEMDITLVFPSLPSSTTQINLIDSTDQECRTYGISLLPPKLKKENVLATIRGNWISQSGTNEWVIGIYDSLAIYRDQFWKYESIKKKGKRYLVTLQNETGSRLLTFKQQKDNLFLISEQENEVLCGLEENNQLNPTGNQQDFTNFFQTDTAYIQGYLQGYDPLLEFSTGMIYIDNMITREDYPTVVSIDPDGRFECKLTLNHPVSQNLNILNHWIPFYIEPGQKLTLYIDYEALLEKSRSRDFYYPLKRIKYMGKTASICRHIDKTDQLFRNDYQMIQKAQKELTPDQFAKQMSPVLPDWLSIVDSIIKTDNYSPISARLLRSKALTTYATGMLDYEMMRGYLAAQDSNNQVLKVKTEDDYYNFLKQIPLDDETLMACPGFSTFINRFEYMGFFKDRGFSSDQEMPATLISSNRERDDKLRNFIGIDHTPVMLQLAQIRRLNFELDFIKDKDKAYQYLQSVRGNTSILLFQQEGERLYNELYAETSGSYPLPAHKKGTEIFRKIADKYKGKYVLVDFWATTCAPCRGGIEGSAQLRTKHKENPDVEFIFITCEGESPEKDYKEYVEKHLKDEHCFRIPDREYHQLRELFRFNGIPHYETLNREGRVLRKGLTYWDFESQLDKLLKQEQNN